MTTKKLLIVFNNCSWKSRTDKIDELRRWFAPKVEFQISVLDTHYADIPFIQYQHPTADQAGIQNRPGIDGFWYDTFVAPLGKGYDIVLFVVDISQWPRDSEFRGWRTDSTFGAIELQVGAGENENFKWGDYVGGAFFNFARHEIMHALFMMTGQEDTTHKWWNQSPQKLSECLNELVFTDPKESDQITWLQKIVAILKGLLFVQKELNKIKMEEDKLTGDIVHESPKMPTKKSFCLAIQEYEGYYAPGEDPKFPHGTLAWRNKNPGNLRYANQIGSIGNNRNFAVFPDYATGFAALMRQVDAACSGRSKVFRPTMNILDFFKVYAPTGDSNDPTAYASFVARRIGVDTSFVIKNLA